jgi:hypothetical protein
LLVADALVVSGVTYHRTAVVVHLDGVLVRALESLPAGAAVFSKRYSLTLSLGLLVAVLVVLPIRVDDLRHGALSLFGVGCDVFFELHWLEAAPEYVIFRLTL